MQQSVRINNFTPFVIHMIIVRPKLTQIFELSDINICKKIAKDLDMFIAPGMYLTLNITFYCPDYDDHYDRFILQSEQLFHMKIPIVAYLEPPCLKSK